MYAVSIESPEQIKIKEVFSMTATLLNSSSNRVAIRHASKLFKFIIKDSKGKRVNVIAMADVGKVGPFGTNETLTEQYEYKLESPGQYEVSAIAVFQIGDGEHQENYELETNKLVIEVMR
ncbi:hypothetical protein D7M11_05390 [Paenibacillus ginsengarvi]|uniref:YtkA-like domain-containing protein n=1 Tax=Paenibacillus ginsengarvi TaxID=400777 RepID=A0A3B0CMN3_9BACL|nr:hypothetical protein D7M11_05390 [Paenibacillus ginsengarvi]